MNSGLWGLAVSTRLLQAGVFLCEGGKKRIAALMLGTSLAVCSPELVMAEGRIEISKCSGFDGYANSVEIDPYTLAFDQETVPDFLVFSAVRPDIDQHVLVIAVTVHTKRRERCQFEFRFSDNSIVFRRDLNRITNWEAKASQAERNALQTAIENCETLRASVIGNTRAKRKYGQTSFWIAENGSVMGGGEFGLDCQLAVGGRALAFTVSRRHFFTIIEDRIFHNGKEL